LYKGYLIYPLKKEKHVQVLAVEEMQYSGIDEAAQWLSGGTMGSSRVTYRVSQRMREASIEASPLMDDMRE
jgi:hypothetical protein